MNGSPADLPLRDIHLPEAVAWWPPALGWWLVLTLVLLLTAAGLWWMRRRRQQALRRAALDELRALRARHARGEDGQALVQALSALLRRAALTSHPRTQVAGLSGDAWLQWLEQQAPQLEFSQGIGRALIEASYAPGWQGDCEALIDLCERWLRQADIHTVARA